MIKSIIFDFDGVLVESVDIKTKAFHNLFEHEGEEVARQVAAYHKQHTGVSRYDKFRYIFKNILKRELPEDVYAGLCDTFSDLVKNEVVKAPYVKGADTFLCDYHSAYKFYISSATPQDEIEGIIRLRGMQRYFKGVFGSPKKKTDIVHDIVSGTSEKGEEIIYVGDALSDYEAAISNSVNFIARINDNEALFENINCIKIEDLTQLKRIIDSEFNR